MIMNARPQPQQAERPQTRMVSVSSHVRDGLLQDFLNSKRRAFKLKRDNDKMWVLRQQQKDGIQELIANAEREWAMMRGTASSTAIPSESSSARDHKQPMFQLFRYDVRSLDIHQYSMIITEQLYRLIIVYSRVNQEELFELIKRGRRLDMDAMKRRNRRR